MLKPRAKLKLYYKEPWKLCTELTIGKVNRIREGEFKVWIEEPPGGRSDKPVLFVAVDKDGNKYEAQPWQDDPNNWGYILQRIK